MRRADEQSGNWKRRRFCGRECDRADRRVVIDGLTPRKIGRYLVYWDNGRGFIVSAKVGGGLRRKSGELANCERCGKEFFKPDNGLKSRWVSCSIKCGRVRLSKTKRNASLAKGGPSKNHLDRWFSLIVRAAGKCVRCGTIERLQCAHIVSRRYTGTRHSLDNALCLCSGCHMFMTYRPLDWEVFVDAHMGLEQHAALKRRALAFRGPLDRVAIAQMLFAEADRLGVTIGGPKTGSGWKGLRDPEALMNERAS